MANWFSTYGKTMGELIRREAATTPLPFVGERLTAAISGQVEIEHYHRYLLAREFCRDLDVLDVASGEGYGTALLAQVAKSAVGIEVDAEVVTAACSEFQRSNLRYEQGDARNIPLPDASIDVAVSFETLEHFTEQDRFLSELRRVLRPNGLLIISTPDRDIYSPVNTPPNPYHAHELSRAEFEAALARHFSHVSLASQRAILGSVIISAGNDVSARSYERRSDTLIEGGDSLMRAPYLIALASNVTLPPLPHSVYVYRSDLDTDYQCRLAAEEVSRAAEKLASEAQGEISLLKARAAEATKSDEVVIRAAEARIDELERELAASTLIYQEREREALSKAAADAAERDLQKDNALQVANARISDLERELAASTLIHQERARELSLQAAADAAQNQLHLKEELRIAAARIEELQRELKTSIKAHQRGVREAANQTRVFEAEREKVDGRAAKLEARLLTASADTQSVAAQLVKQETARLAAQAQIANLESQLWAAEIRARDGQEREANARSEIASLEQRSEVLRTRVLAAERDREAWRREASALAERLTAIETSTSWRATGPLRRVGGRFPKLAWVAGRTAKVLWWTVTFQLFEKYEIWRDQRPSKEDAASPESGTLHVELTSKVLEQNLSAALEPSTIRVPSSETPLVSVVIPTYGQLEVTLACLKSIAEHAPSCSIEVLVVDDAYAGPEDISTLERVVGIKYLRNPENLGFLLSCNAAAKYAKGTFIYFLNNDTELLSGSIDALVGLLESRPDAGMAGSKLIFPDGKLQEAGGIIWKDATGWNYGRGDDPSLEQYNYVREVDYCSGASLMVRRQLFEKLGGFDKDYVPAYYEDTDLAFRIRAQGLKVLYEPGSVVIHHEGMSHGTDVKAGVKAHQVLNQVRFYERWKGVLEEQNYSNAECVIRARDRARSRKMILVIDHYVPEPDRDAGSRSTMGIIDSLVDANWLVKFWPQNRAYHPVYTTALERRGIEVLDGRVPGNLADWLSNYGNELDHLLVSRPDVAVDVLPSVLSGTNAVLSFYGHDLHFQRVRRQAKLENDKKLHSQAAKMERLERKVWEEFDVVLYPSEEEAAIVRKMSPASLTRAIIPFWFDTFPPRSEPVQDRSILFVAGFAHPPNVDAARYLIREILPLIEGQIGSVKVVLAGSNPTEAVKNLAGPNVEVTGYVTEERLAELYYLNRVAVVPLRFGAGVKGKVIEALSRGLPLITTSIGSEGIPGLDAVVPVRNEAADIAEALKLLLTDDVTWLAQAQAQMQLAQRCFSRAAMQHSVLSALKEGETAHRDKLRAVAS
jgi:GT2 family glycosyltransferase/SAM-dependent methyltransferase/glycosyltransferase involved in cell wall biosynthesis